MTQSPATRKTFASAAKPYLQLGIPASELLPVIPHDAELSARSTVKREHRGKVPGRFLKDGKWAGMAGWQNEGLDSGTRAACQAWPTQNVGLRAALFPAIDIDVRSSAARNLVDEFFTFVGPELFVSAPVRTRGKSPRAMQIYRQAPGMTPVRKMRLAFRMPNDPNEHVVEVLGHGQQYLIHGTHPSGEEYGWQEGFDLRTVGQVEALQAVSGDDMRDMLDGLRVFLEGDGCVIVDQSQGSSSAGTEGQALRDMEPELTPSVALDALSHIPNTPEVLPDRLDLVRVLAGFKAALGKRAEEYKADACAWATAHGWADTEYFEKQWDSLDRVRVGSSALIHEARKHGFDDTALDFPDLPAEEIAAAIETVEAKDQKTLKAVADKLVWWNDGQRFFVRGTTGPMTKEMLNTHPLGLSIEKYGAPMPKSAATQLLNSGFVQRVSGISYAPGKAQTFDWDLSDEYDGKFYNLWTPGRKLLDTRVTDNAIKPWLDHIAVLLPDEGERRALLRWMGHVLQRPGKKIRWAPLIVGVQGIGKDMALRPLMWALAQNQTSIAQSRLEGNFTDFYKKQLVMVEELSRTDRYNLYERLKAAVSGTSSDTLHINEKYEKSYPVKDALSFVFLSNHSDAIAIPPDDRRFFVLSCAPSKRLPNAHYMRLGHFYSEEDGLLKVASWLNQLALDDFDADSAPLHTEAKSQMMVETLGNVAQWVLEMVERNEGVFENRTVLTMREIKDALTENQKLPRPVRDKLTDKSIGYALGVAGWTRMEHQVTWADRARLWMNPEVAAMARADQKRRYLEERGVVDQKRDDEARDF